MGEGREAHEGGDIYKIMTDFHCIALWQKPTQCCKAIILQLIFFYFQRKLFKEKTEKNALLIDCLIITIVLYLGTKEVDCYVLHLKIKRI